jgi:hypothetical protein
MRARTGWMVVTLAAGALVGLGLVSGCGQKTHLIGPANQLEVSNAPDNFQFQATALDHVEQTLTFTWSMSETVADVNQACSISEGTGTLILRDSTGTEVYRRSLSDNGTFNSELGVAGNWTIDVVLDKVSGTLNFRVQKHG